MTEAPSEQPRYLTEAESWMLGLFDSLSDQVKALTLQTETLLHIGEHELKLAETTYSLVKSIQRGFVIEVEGLKERLSRIEPPIPAEIEAEIDELLALNLRNGTQQTLLNLSDYLNMKAMHTRNVPPGLRFDVLKRDKFVCQLCGRRGDTEHHLEVDHKVPIAKGGTNDPSNLWALCWACNRGKSDKEL